MEPEGSLPCSQEPSTDISLYSMIIQNRVEETVISYSRQYYHVLVTRQVVCIDNRIYYSLETRNWK
jgi:hypothetical protein